MKEKLLLKSSFLVFTPSVMLYVLFAVFFCLIVPPAVWLLFVVVNYLRIIATLHWLTMLDCFATVQYFQLPMVMNGVGHY